MWTVNEEEFMKKENALKRQQQLVSFGKGL